MELNCYFYLHPSSHVLPPTDYTYIIKGQYYLVRAVITDLFISV